MNNKYDIEVRDQNDYLVLSDEEFYGTTQEHTIESFAIQLLHIAEKLESMEEALIYIKTARVLLSRYECEETLEVLANYEEDHIDLRIKINYI
jgi:hypothetical protein